MNRYIYITTNFEGFHRYNEAPTEVAYLRNTHRHIFGVLVKIEVMTDDRDIEFIMFKHEIERYINKFKGDNNALSCEMMAEDIYNHCKAIYALEDKIRRVEVIVNEDEENGAMVGDF